MSTPSSATLEVLNYIGGQWIRSSSPQTQEVVNPATAEVLARVPLSGAEEVERAVQAAESVMHEWRCTPPGERVQCLFEMKQILEHNLEDIATTLVKENGKTLAEAKGELRRAIENVEVACGIPMLMQGYNLEDIAAGIDEGLIRQPVGIVAAITPFNFPGMIPFWFLPYAIACGNCFILKPSERVPLTMQHIFRLMEKLTLPKGVLGLVNGGRQAVDALLVHPKIRAVSFVDRPRWQDIYTRARPRTGSGCNARVAPRTTPLFFPTQISAWPAGLSAKAHLPALASAVLRFPSRSQWEMRERDFVTRLRRLPRHLPSAMVSKQACVWGPSLPPTAVPVLRDWSERLKERVPGLCATVAIPESPTMSQEILSRRPSSIMCQLTASCTRRKYSGQC